MKSDEEIKKSFSVVVHDGILDTAFLIPFPSSEDGYRQSELYRDAVFEVIKNTPGTEPLDGIVDLRPIEHTNVAPPARAGKLYQEVASHPRVRRVAIIGIRPFYRTLTKFVMMVAGKGDLFKMFNDKDGALKWFKETN